MRRSGSLRLLPVVVGVLALAWTGRGLRVESMDHYISSQRYEDVYYLPPAEWLPVLSLGYREALADLIWMRALVYFGLELEHRGRVENVFNYADAILTLDPRFRRAYTWAGAIGMYRPAGHTVQDVRRSIEYLERGSAEFPDDGDLAWDLGASLAFELAPIVDDPEEKNRLKLDAVEHMQTAARLGAGPPWLTLTNATQLERLGRTEQAIRHLEEMYPYVDNAAAREQIEMRLEALRSEAHGQAFRHFHQELEQRRSEEFPYVDRGLYPLLGPRLPLEDGPWAEQGFLIEEGLAVEQPLD